MRPARATGQFPALFPRQTLFFRAMIAPGESMGAAWRSDHIVVDFLGTNPRVQGPKPAHRQSVRSQKSNLDCRSFGK
jgi:hypothetical protein